MYSLTLIAGYRLILIPFIFFILPNIVVAENKINHINSLKLYTPKDIEVTLFSKDVPQARHMAFDDQGVLFVSQTKDGRVIALPDEDKNGRADQKVLIIETRRAPHGLAFTNFKENYYLYVAEETKVIRLKRIQKPFTYGEPETIINGIPSGGHYTRTIKIKDGKLYLSIGSSCNFCIEKHPWRAAITSFNLDGSGADIFQGIT